MNKNMFIAVAEFLALLVTLPIIFIAKSGARAGIESWFTGPAQFLSLIPGKTGMLLRRAYYRRTLAGCRERLVVGFGSYFSKSGAVVGTNVYIGAYCIVGLTVLGDGAVLGSRVSVTSGRRQHNFEDPDRPIFGMDRYDRVRIGSHSFIGEGSVVMAAVGEKSIVGAGSVVVKEVPPQKVVAGNPARVVRDREADTATIQAPFPKCS